MTELDMPIIQLLEDNQAVQKGHYIYTSGNHGELYIAKNKLYEKPRVAKEIGKRLASAIGELTEGVEVIVGPAIGGIILAQWTAYEMDVLFTNTEKNEEGVQYFRRGIETIKGRNVAIVEDLVTTGKSVNEVIAATRELDADVRIVAAMLDRSPLNKPAADAIDADYIYLERLPTVIYDPKNCALCEHNVPINTDLGHGKMQEQHEH
ncbi:MAG: hypothetical protein HZC02_02400 [Candidatus Levybacteria bacterium]|nr:hypothetical protein [Candidatus Levybacteria bacterium]